MKAIFHVFFLILFPFILLAEGDTIIVTGVNGRLHDSISNEQMLVVENRGSERIQVTFYTWIDGKWVKEKTERSTKLAPNRYRMVWGRGRNKTSLTREYRLLDSGYYEFVESIGQQVVRRGTTLLRFPILPHGVLLSYYPNGPLKSEEIFQNNEMVSNKNWLENGLPYVDDLFYSVDRYPAYSRGNEQINRQILAKLKENKVDFSAIAGTLELGFVIYENGKIGSFRVLKSIDPELEEMVVDAIRSLEGEWTPARLNDRPVRFFQRFPIHFNHYEMQVEFFDYHSGLVQFERK